MNHEKAKARIRANGLEIWHGSAPKAYRVGPNDISGAHSIQLRSVDLPAFARMLDHVARNAREQSQKPIPAPYPPYND